MLKIRLSRGGRKKVPFYRIVASNSTSRRDSKFLEKLGIYNPLLAKDNEKRVEINKERAEYWLSVGARPSEKVAKFLKELGCKGAEKHQPNFVAKKKGEGLKKKALEKVKADEEAKVEAAAKAEEEAKAAADAKIAEAEAAKAAKEEPKAEEVAAEAKEEPKTEEAAKE